MVEKKNALKLQLSPPRTCDWASLGTKMTLVAAAENLGCGRALSGTQRRWGKGWLRMRRSFARWPEVGGDGSRRRWSRYGVVRRPNDIRGSSSGLYATGPRRRLMLIYYPYSDISGNFDSSALLHVSWDPVTYVSRFSSQLFCSWR